MNRSRFLLSICFLACAVEARAQEGFSLFTTDFPPEEFAARRSAVYDAIGKGAIAVVQGAPTPIGYTRFRQSNDFYYLSGIEVPNAYLVLDGSSRKTALYLPHRNEGRERGEGKVLSAEDAAEVTKLSGVDAVFGTDLLAEHLARTLQRRAPLTSYSPSSRPKASPRAATWRCGASPNSRATRSKVAHHGPATSRRSCGSASRTSRSRTCPRSSTT